MSGCKIIRIKNKLGELLSVPGGVSRDEAVGEATRLIEELREDCEKAVPVEITRLEDMVAEAGEEISRQTLQNVIDQTDPLLTLSGTFGSEILDAVVKRFCDLCMGMVDKDITATAPLNVHFRAMRLVYKSELSDQECAAILAELSRIHAYYGIVPNDLKASQPSDKVPG